MSGSIWLQEGLWGSSPLCCGIVVHHDFFPPSCSSWGSGACFPSFLFFPFSGIRLCSIVIFWLLLVPGSGSGLSPFFSFVSFFRNGAPNEFFIAHERRGKMVCCCLGLGVYAGVFCLFTVVHVSPHINNPNAKLTCTKVLQPNTFGLRRFDAVTFAGFNPALCQHRLCWPAKEFSY